MRRVWNEARNRAWTASGNRLGWMATETQGDVIRPGSKRGHCLRIKLQAVVSVAEKPPTAQRRLGQSWLQELSNLPRLRAGPLVRLKPLSANRNSPAPSHRRLSRRGWITGLLVSPSLLSGARLLADSPTRTTVSYPERVVRTVEGWTVRIDTRLWSEQRAATDKALELLVVQLREIIRVVPAPAVQHLRRVTLWFTRTYPGEGGRAEYHPGAGWLRDNGRDPAMVQGVEFTDIPDFESETRRMPNFTLHELAHGYHDRVLPGGFSNAEIAAAYKSAKASQRYERVQRKNAAGQVNWDRAYAMTNPMEYFAESTEAFFSRNDFFPFNRTELQQHDPDMDALLVRLWGRKS